MSFVQFKLDESINQSREIFNKYIYETGDSVLDVSSSGYFSESRFLRANPDRWIGGIVEAKTSDGYVILQINADGVTADVVGGGVGGDPNYVGEDQSASPSATGPDSLAMGPGANATGAYSVVAGANARSPASHGVAIGVGTILENGATYGMVFGRGAYIAVGNTNAISVGSYAGVGRYSLSGSPGTPGEADRGISIGAYSWARIGLEGVCIGAESSIGNPIVADYSVAIGGFAYCTDGADQLAVGNRANAYAAGATAIGKGTDSLAEDSLSIGRNTLTSGANGISIGGHGTAVDAASATASNAMAFGVRALAQNVGEVAFSTGGFAAAGDANKTVFICRGATADATITNINPDGGVVNRMMLPLDALWGFEILLSVREDSTSDSAVIRYDGGIKRDGASVTSLVGAGVNTTVIAQDAGALTWTASITADNSGEALQIAVTGEAAHNLRWVAVVRITEVSG